MRKSFSKFAQVAGIMLALTFTFSCSDDKDDGGGSDFTGTSGTFKDDRDSKSYKWVKIGELVWMAENLNYRGKEPDTLGRCYDNDPANCTKYGRLYDWATAKVACPKDWHLPKWGNEWQELVDIAGGARTAGTKLKAGDGKGWNTSNGYKAGTDDYGFSALPGGYSYSVGGGYDLKSRGYWWSAAEDINNAFCGEMRYDDVSVFSGYHSKSTFYSVRCIKD
jgi:uncharacterized protein (TIGR02145 family)